MSQLEDLLSKLDANLADGCEAVEAGFYFEEGGCFGMALALHAEMSAAGGDPRLTICEHDFVHAMVEIDGGYFDHRGKYPPREAMRPVDTAEFMNLAQLYGHGPEKIESDRAWASNAIAFAIAHNDLPQERHRA